MVHAVDAPVTVEEAVALQPPIVDHTRVLPLRPLALPPMFEPLWKRMVYWLLAIGLAGAYLATLLIFFVPAAPGVDDNGYLVGGKQIAVTGSSGIHKANPYQFHGLMWVMTSGDKPGEELWVYPKYPIGLPLMNAIPLWINWDLGKSWAIYTSPVCTALALLMVFGFVREIAGSFMGLLAMLLVGLNYVTLILSELPLSHAADLLCVTAGFWMLLRWWRSGFWLTGAAAGFLIGYATTIRYSNGLLLLPLALAVLTTIRWRASIFRLWWWRPLVALAIVAGLTALRLKLNNRFTPVLTIAGLLLTAAALFPWQDRSRRELILRAVATALLAAMLVQAKLPSHVELDWQLLRTKFEEWNKLPHSELKALIILAATSVFAFGYLYAPCVLRRALLPMLCWILPVLWLIGFNYFAMGGITGYDTTNEAKAFTLEQMGKKWEFAVQQIYDVGSFCILPLGIIGLITMYRWSWRLALLLTLWLLPSTLLYFAYYWGNGLAGVGDLRFFTALLPVFAITAVWFLRHGGWNRYDEQLLRRGSIALPLAAGAIVAAATGFGLRNALPILERQQIVALSLKYSADTVVMKVPKNAVLFTQQRAAGDAMNNWLQWAGDFEIYHALFSRDQYMMPPKNDPETPSPRDPKWYAFMRAKLEKMTDQQIIDEQIGIMRTALNAKRPLYALLPTNWVAPFNGKFITGSPFVWKKIVQWRDPASPLPEINVTPLMPRPRGSVNRAQNVWTIYQIEMKPDVAVAASKPSTTQAVSGK